MKKPTTFLFLYLLIFQCLGQAKKDNYRELLPVIDLWLEAQKDFDRLPGISVAIVQDQEILFQKGYGYADVEKKVPMKAETVFSICSISKLFTSVAVMQLWEQGKIALDDSLPALLPEYRIRQQFSGSLPITVRSMLTHSSGLPRESDYPYWSSPNFYFPTKEEIRKKITEQETLYPASTYLQYSNLGMTLLGEIVAAKSGKSYNDYVEAKILKPLQLSNTRPYLPENLWRNEMATGYSALYREGNRKMIPIFKPNGITAAAGFSSNVIDLARFASWQFRVLSGSKAEILKPATLKEMQRIQWISPDKNTTWGLGFIIAYDGSGNVKVGHDGSCPGYVSSLMIDPKKKLGVTLMINAQGVSTSRYSEVIFNLLNKSVAEDSATKNIDLNVYKGKYDSYTWSGETVVMPVKGKLIIFGLPSSSPHNFQVYQYVKKDTFRRVRPDDNTLGEELRFERDQKDQIFRLWIHSTYQDKLN